MIDDFRVIFSLWLIDMALRVLPDGVEKDSLRWNMYDHFETVARNRGKEQ